MPDIDADVGFVTESWDCDVRLRLAIGVDLTLADLHRPTRIRVLLGRFCTPPSTADISRPRKPIERDFGMQAGLPHQPTF